MVVVVVANFLLNIMLFHSSQILHETRISMDFTPFLYTSVVAEMIDSQKSFDVSAKAQVAGSSAVQPVQVAAVCQTIRA